MFVVKDNVHINAPIERCFLLSTSLELVGRELGMEATAGSFVAEDGARRAMRTRGLVVGGDRIRWEGWKFGLPQTHVSLISEYVPYSFFQDRMIAGRFQYFQHDHEFTEVGGQVLLKDVVRFSLPLGIAGRLVGKRIVVPHVRLLLRRRFQLLRGLAESDGWRKYLPQE
jgi:ligand-binding SRPBCC domain-containing protein